MWDSWRAYRSGRAAILARQQARIALMTAHARARSPLYRDLYRTVPAHAPFEALPVTSKAVLMERFDEWCVDPTIDAKSARAFVDDPSRIGERYLERYTLLTTSGTSGARGLFVLDEHTMQVTNAMALRMLSHYLGVRDVLHIIRGGMRMAMVMAEGGHFASAVAAMRLQRKLGARVTTLSVHQPLGEIVQRLNDAQPVLLAPYASTAALLASEQEAGRLSIHPVLIALAAEGLAPDEYARIGRAFGAHVLNSYAATECPFLSFSCVNGWLHVNADWVAIEPVDAHYRPVPAGTPSHTVLITNLANRVQPLIRYDLRDSVLEHPGPCACGSPLPAIRVQGRSGELLRLQSSSGEVVSLAPLAIATTTDAVPGLQQTQVVQIDANALRVRIRIAPDADHEMTWARLNEALQRLLKGQGLDNVRIERASEMPVMSPGGKYRAVMPLEQSPINS